MKLYVYIYVYDRYNMYNYTVYWLTTILAEPGR
jgi:hypothetical protein